MNSKLITLAALSLVLISSVAHAAPQSPVASLSQAQQDYCHAYAESEYDAAVARGDGLPDASYEGAQEQCEMQWLIVNASK